MARPKESSMMLTSLEDNLSGCGSCAKRAKNLPTLGDSMRSALSGLSDSVMVALSGLADASRCVEPMIQTAAEKVPTLLIARPKKSCNTCGSPSGGGNANGNGKNAPSDNANANNNQNTINIVLPPLGQMYGMPVYAPFVPNGNANANDNRSDNRSDNRNSTRGNDRNNGGNDGQTGTVPVSPANGFPNGFSPFAPPVSPFAPQFAPQGAMPQNGSIAPEREIIREPVVIEKEVPVIVPQIKEVVKNRYLQSVKEGKTKFYKQVVFDDRAVNRPTVETVYDQEAINRPTVNPVFDEASINRPTVAPVFDQEGINRPTVRPVFDGDAVNRPTVPEESTDKPQKRYFRAVKP